MAPIAGTFPHQSTHLYTHTRSTLNQRSQQCQPTPQPQFPTQPDLTITTTTLTASNQYVSTQCATKRQYQHITTATKHNIITKHVYRKQHTRSTHIACTTYRTKNTAVAHVSKHCTYTATTNAKRNRTETRNQQSRHRSTDVLRITTSENTPLAPTPVSTSPHYNLANRLTAPRT